MTNGAVTLSGTKSLSVLNLAGGSPIISGTNTITTANLSGGTGTSPAPTPSPHSP